MKLTFETPTMYTGNKNAKLAQCTHETTQNGRFTTQTQLTRAYQTPPPTNKFVLIPTTTYHHLPPPTTTGCGQYTIPPRLPCDRDTQTNKPRRW